MNQKIKTKTLNNYIVSQETYLDQFLLSLKYNLKQIKKLLLNNSIYVNNQLVNNMKFMLYNNDTVNIKLNNNYINNDINYDIYQQISIVYEDDYLFVFNKPSGLLTIPDKYSDLSLYNYLNKYDYLKQIERNGIVHRLDKDTNGMIIVAKNIDVYSLLLNDFKHNKIFKKYYALVNNHFESFQKYFINKPIGYKDDKHLKFTTINPKNPKECLTYFKPIKNLNNNLSLVDIELITGRTHQIRVHMSSINHPVYNDPLYSKNKINDEYNQYLMNYHLKFLHPITYVEVNLIIDFDFKFKQKLIELEYEYA